jgi:undecaprenyl diphosphate synthase
MSARLDLAFGFRPTLDVTAEPAKAAVPKPAAAVPAAPVPRHVAIIMDGNGRWAERKGMPRFEGHRRGVEAVRAAVRAAIDVGIQYLTLYSFSSENWSRPPREVSELMGLLRFFIRNDMADLHRNGVRIRILGERAGIPADIIPMLDEAETLTKANAGLQLQVAFNYGARQEIVHAVRRLAEEIARGERRVEDINQVAVESGLYTAGLPDPDLVIRTSGEQRLSNFLLWQAAYAEFVFLPVLWPDFGRGHLEEALAQFAGRRRRYGGVAEVR